MSEDGVKLNQTDPLLEQPEGWLGAEVAWLRSSVVGYGRLVMTVALAKLSFGTVSAWAAVPSPIAATANPAASVISKRARRPMPPPGRPRAWTCKTELCIEISPFFMRGISRADLSMAAASCTPIAR